MATAVEEAQGDQVDGGAEPVGDPHQQSQLGVDALRQRVRQAVGQRGDDPGAVLARRPRRSGSSPARDPILAASCPCPPIGRARPPCGPDSSPSPRPASRSRQPGSPVTACVRDQPRPGRTRSLDAAQPSTAPDLKRRSGKVSCLGRSVQRRRNRCRRTRSRWRSASSSPSRRARSRTWPSNQSTDDTAAVWTSVEACSTSAAHTAGATWPTTRATAST